MPSSKSCSSTEGLRDRLHSTTARFRRTNFPLPAKRHVSATCNRQGDGVQVMVTATPLARCGGGRGGRGARKRARKMQGCNSATQQRNKRRKTPSGSPGTVPQHQAHLHCPSLHQQLLALLLPGQVCHARHTPAPGLQSLGTAQTVQDHRQVVRVIALHALFRVHILMKLDGGGGTGCKEPRGIKASGVTSTGLAGASGGTGPHLQTLREAKTDGGQGSRKQVPVSSPSADTCARRVSRLRQKRRGWRQRRIVTCGLMSFHS
jgi:hypothetical protein